MIGDNAHHVKSRVTIGLVTVSSLPLLSGYVTFPKWATWGIQKSQ